MSVDAGSRGASGDDRGRILLLAHRPLGESSFGGGQRTMHIRAAAAELGDVDTLVISAGDSCSRTLEWDAQRSRALTYRTGGPPASGLLDRLRVRRWVREVLVGGDYDVVVARYLSTALTVPRSFRGRLVFVADDIVKTTPSSAGGLRGVLATRRASVRRVLVDRLLQQAFHVWFVNPEDLAALGGHARSASLLPNAAMTYQASPVPRDPATLLIVGQYSHEPNREAVDFLVTSVLPGLRAARPDVVLRVVGSVPPDCAARWAGVPGVEVRGFVDDLGPEYARATLAVAPIHSGGGTQIKVIEALANGCPIVVSTFAHRGFAQVLDAGRHLFVAESASQWIDVCLDALGDPGRAEEMAGAASDVVRRTYGVDALRERVRLTMRPLLHPVADAAPHAPAAVAHPGVRPGHGTLGG